MINVCVHMCEWVIWGGGQVMYVFIVCVCMHVCIHACIHVYISTHNVDVLVLGGGGVYICVRVCVCV